MKCFIPKWAAQPFAKVKLFNESTFPIKVIYFNLCVFFTEADAIRFFSCFQNMFPQCFGKNELFISVFRSEPGICVIIMAGYRTSITLWEWTKICPYIENRWRGVWTEVMNLMLLVTLNPHSLTCGRLDAVTKPNNEKRKWHICFRLVWLAYLLPVWVWQPIRCVCQYRPTERPYPSQM